MSEPQVLRIWAPLIRVVPRADIPQTAGAAFTAGINARSRALSGTMVYGVEGECLSPYISPGDALWVDPNRRARDGDLVVGTITYRDSGVAKPRTESHDAVKVLRIINGRWLLCALDGAVSIEPQHVIGPVVAWYRPGWWHRPSVKRLAAEVSLSRKAHFGELRA